jgi:hypothetical protein
VGSTDLPVFGGTTGISTTLSIDGSGVDIFQFTQSSSVNSAALPIGIRGGIRMTLVNGTAVAGEVMEITLIATRVG